MKGCQIEICSLFLAKKGKFATKLSKYLFSSENMKFSLCEEEVLQARKTCIAQSVVLLLESPFCRKPDTFSSVGSSKSSFSRLASVPSQTSRSPKTISPTLRVRDVCLFVWFFFFFFFSFFLLFSLFALFAWLLWPVHTLLNASANRSPHFDSSFRLLVFVVSNFFFFFFFYFLLVLLVNRIVKPRTVGNTSIPAMLQTFQNEFDALMLETYELRSQLDQ